MPNRTIESGSGTTAVAWVGGSVAFRKIGSDIDLVVSDIKMPKLDGIQLANLVCAEFPKIPIILISGYVDVALENQPWIEFIPKPFSCPACLIS